MRSDPNEALPARTRRLTILPALGLLCLIFLPAAGAAQTTASVATEENVRAEPNGLIIGQLHAGTPVTVVSIEGQWSEITFDGFVWIPSLQMRTEGQFDLIVSASEGENLRAEPSGPIIGRLGSGTLLLERGRIPGWVEVERTAWIWSPSLSDESDTPSPAAEPTAPGEPEPSPAAAAPPAAGAEGAGSAWMQSEPGGSSILTSPDGDTLATARPGSSMQVISREGNWARVRVEGWVWAPDGAEDAADDSEAVLRGVSAADLSGDPARYRGRVVEMELQFISLERAEAVRADFQEGEPFLLTRSTGPDRSFVYLAIASSEVEAARRMTPLDRLSIVGRVRTGAAALTGNPVLDLLELRVIR
ncbi:MAG: hypothetical protein EA351_03085 [Gemmatimonadales bacterium]|nr:MAG: hypothetical protein EA351_03085 [Gemmatimonadales bacterium]